VDMCQQFTDTILMNVSKQKVSNISRPAAQSLRTLGNSSSADRHLIVSNNGWYA